MKKFNNFSILRPGKLFLLTLATWLTMAPAWGQSEPDYLCFTATADGTTIQLKNSQYNDYLTQQFQWNNYVQNISLEYSNNGIDGWKDFVVSSNPNAGQNNEFYFSVNSIHLNAGEKAYIRSKNATNPAFAKSVGYEDYTPSGYRYSGDQITGNYFYFDISNAVDCSGKVLSLISRDCSMTQLPDYAFAGLFQSCSSLLSAPELPGSDVTLGKYCYYGMFFLCYNLSIAPTLPAEELKDYCYAYMFEGCQALQYLEVGFKNWHDNATRNWAKDFHEWFNYQGYIVTMSTTGIFKGPSSLYNKANYPEFPYGTSKIPNGWTVEDYNTDYLTFTWNGSFTYQGQSWHPGNLKTDIFFKESAQMAMGNQSAPWNRKNLQYSYNGRDWFDWNYANGDKLTIAYGSTVSVRCGKADGYSTLSESADKYYYFESKFYNTTRSVVVDSTEVSRNQASQADVHYEKGKTSQNGQTANKNNYDYRQEVETNNTNNYDVRREEGKTVRNGQTADYQHYDYRKKEGKTQDSRGTANKKNYDYRELTWSGYEYYWYTYYFYTYYVYKYYFWTYYKYIREDQPVYLVEENENAPGYNYQNDAKVYGGILGIHGNVMCLLDQKMIKTDVEKYCFTRLFSGPNGNSMRYIYSAPSLPALDLAPNCYESMFEGCAYLKTAPTLATTSDLIEESGATNCYKNMFKNCSRLNYMQVGFDKWSTVSVSSFTEDWVKGVTTESGTFHCPNKLTKEFTDSRIPTKWEQSGNTEGTNEEEDWLCFTSATDIATVRLDKSNSTLDNLDGKLEYSFTGDDGDWKTYTWSNTNGKVISLNAKEGKSHVFFRTTVTDDNGQCSESSTLYYTFKFSGTIEASGNIMSLLHKNCNRIDVDNSEFLRLFYNCTTLKSAPELPATQLGDYCYQEMFYGCKTLITPPELPATELKTGCYNVMFGSCSGMSSAPDLPATSLATSCYKRMFEGCSTIQNAPILPATDLVSFCYNQMFKNCSSLKYINVNFLEWKDNLNATTGWVTGVNDNGIFFCPSVIAAQPEYGADRVPKLDQDYKRWIIKENDNTGLYFEARRNSSTIRLDKKDNVETVKLAYSTDDGQTWSNYTWSGNTGSTITLNKVGTNRVYFKAGEVKAGKVNPDSLYNVTNETFSSSGNAFYRFVMRGSFNAHGNIMSLLSTDGSLTSVPAAAFLYLFKDCKVLHTAPSLPATTLSNQCYQNMFYNCTSLTTAPELPATVMQEHCYSGMFSGCTSLQKAPKLPAMTLSTSCYASMFEGNTSLTKAPELPAKVLQKNCYATMFKGCSSLDYVNVGFKTWHSTATTNWFADSDDGTQTIKSAGIFMCPNELPHDKNANPSYYGASRIPKADVDGQRWNVNVVALRFTANNDAKISLVQQGEPDDVDLLYSIDNAISWHHYVYGEVVTLKPGDNIFIKANDVYTSLSKDANNYYQFKTIGSLSVDGSIMSLTDSLARGTSVPAYSFYKLFEGCEGLANVPELPASTVGDYGYANMFSGCIALTEVDTLRATELGQYCYNGMFSNCTNLKTAPVLPVESLNDYCYANMFDGCSGLKNAPELPATTLKTGCYQAMFQNCKSLKIAPELPASTLVSNCYNSMFSGCSLLSEISVNFSAWSPSDATDSWVSGVANDGIFSCPKNLPVNKFNAHRVPKNNTYKWDINPDFLGFKATEETTIALNRIGMPDPCMLIYSINSKSKWQNYSWNDAQGLVINLKEGESVYFKAESDSIEIEDNEHNITLIANKLSKDAENYYQFDIQGAVSASGYVSFLLSRSNKNEIVPAYGFYRLFKDCTGLITAPEVSTCNTANAHSYESLFEGCSNMTTSPETLPATTLAESCYKNMFKGCEKMATSPDSLRATSVAVSCYESMFEGDSLITRIPTLGVSTTSAKAAYKNMFKGCKSMTSDNMPSTLFNNNSVSESFYEGMFDGCSTIEKAEFDLPAGGLSKACYKNMFRGCSSLTKVPKKFETPWNIIESCYEGMFEGCSSLETAPKLAWTNNAAKNSFKNIFKGCTALHNNIPSAMSSNLATSCYESMFEGCESMITTPSLPTTNLAEGCYKAMFKGCTSLVSSALPTLPARFMKTSCYESMFEGCTGVTTPATQYQIPDPWNAYTLAEACFKNMYKGCTSLTSTPNTFNNALYASCFEGMFEGCTSLTKVPSLAQDILATRCYYRMFAGCTSLKQAPELPAKKENLKDSCYAYMFNGCTNLHYMDVAFNEWRENLGATHMWVENVSPTGTFMCPDGLPKTQDESHIPKDWSAEDNGDYLCFTALSNEWTDLQLQKQGSPNQLSYKYSRDKKNWTSVAGGTYQQLMGGVSVGTTVYIKITEGRLSKDANNYWKFTCNKPVAVSGNITSLLDASMEQTDVPDYSFYKLFAGCTSIQDISGLKMPATEVGAYAYANMFEGCTYLQNNSTVAPELPATTLGNYCYQNLFKGWKKLQVAPALPAKTLAEGCYSNMFNGCTDLKSVSALPATELQTKCYESMFAGCTKLDSLNVAFTAWSPASATNNWVAGVSDEGNFVCPWALAQDAISKSDNNLEDAYGESMIPKDHDNPWLILLVTDMEFDYKTGTMTIAGRKPITYTTDPSLTVDNRIGTTVNVTSTTVDLKDWLNDASITDLDSITYYAIAGESMNGGKIKPTVNKMTIYRYPKKIDMCICDNETRLKKALYYANKVSSPRYPIKLFIPDGTYNLDETLVVSDSTISLIGESLNGTILKSSAPNGVFKITGDNVYMQDMKLANTASGAAFTNRSLNTTMRVAIDGYYIEAPGGVESKRYALPEATWNRATDPTQATIASVSQNGSTLCVTPGENNTSKYLVRVDNKYSFASTKDFFILESLEGKNVYVRAANARGAFGEPVSPDKIEANGSEYTKLTIKLNGNGFSSFSFDDPLVDQLKVIGASVYKGVYHEGAVYLTRLNEHDIVPRGTGVILAGLPNATLQLYYDNATVDHDPYKDVTGDNIPLYGNCNEAIQRKPGDGKYYYGLSGNVFKKLSETGSVKPNKAFFDLTGKVDANASSIRIIFGMWEEEEEEVVSGINYLPTSGDGSEYSYTLTGVRMKEAKGLVIQNNKVVLVK